MNRILAAISAVAAVAALGAVAGTAGGLAVLPNGWLIKPSTGLVVQTDTFPQGAAASPDGGTLAVVESGYNPPSLHLYDATDLKEVASIPLKGAFGRPVWLDADYVLVAGANTDALLEIDVRERIVKTFALGKGSYPIAVATNGSMVAVATEGDHSVRIGSLAGLDNAKPMHTGESFGLAFSADGKTLFASNAGARSITAVDTQTLAARTIPTGLHPTALLVSGTTLYVAETDADSVGVFDATSRARIGDIYVGDDAAHQNVTGVSPNGLAMQDDALYVSLGAANEIAVIRNQQVVGRIPAGWYPTAAVPIGKTLYIVDGKGEGTRPNPRYVGGSHSDVDYVAAIQYGSIRTFDLSNGAAAAPNPQGANGWSAAQASSVIRKGGPIRHVFFILKENRSYDQVLGDMPRGNGDLKLTWFGANVTPNEHAIAARFGLFDNTYTSGEVSESGHNWSDAAFDDDFVERMWPLTYGNRRDVDDSRWAEEIPRNGFIWQAARAAHVSFRDYGETVAPNTGKPGQTPDASVAAVYDPNYEGWNLAYSDLKRVAEWRREFSQFVRAGDVPQLEYLWLPNDHTYGSRPKLPTPRSMVAQNDYALGEILETISHSPIWGSSAVFVIEDDSQDGPDHVSGQRTTFFLASPYARGGVRHERYSTVSVLRTMELILGIPPLSTYDAMAVPLRDAFTAQPNLLPYTVISPRVSLAELNRATAYGADLSAKLNFSRPDAIAGDTMLRILAHNH